MSVRRIVANLKTREPEKLADFYKQLLELDIVMDLGWIITASSDEENKVQMSFASQGGSGTPTPALSIEVDNFEETVERALLMNCSIEHGPVDEPWGVRRFFVRDPAGNLLNILTHLETA